VIQEGTLRKRERYGAIVDKIDIFGEMTVFEKGQMVDALVEREVRKGDYVIHQGDSGSEFFIIEEGQADALKTQGMFIGVGLEVWFRWET
jgi:cAMP-dependent protein kinase regulator